MIIIKRVLDHFRSVLSGFRSGKSLKARTARGSMWLGIGSGAEQTLRLVRNMILARLLVPEVFGLMAIVLAVNTFFESFTEVGIKEAIIQHPEGDVTTYLNGAWFLSCGRASILYLIAYIGAPYIAQFYNNPELIPIMRVAFLSIVFRGLMSSRAYITVKHMKFNQWIKVEQSGGVIGIITAIGLAFILQNVWALVIGFTVEAIARTLLSYIVCPFVPRFNFKRSHFIALLKFARGMLGLPILTFIFSRIDVFVIGKVLTTEELGLYSMAAALANVPSLFISKFVAPLLMPAFSEMQNENERINNSVLDINTAFALIGMPLMVFVFFYGKSLLSIIYTSQYAQVSIPFAILFSAIIFRNCNVPIVSIYLAKGQPGLLRIFIGVRAMCIAAMIYPAVRYFGLIGAASAVLLSMGIAYFIQILRMRKITHLSVSRYWLTFFWPLIFSTIIAVIWYATHFARPLSLGIDILVGTTSLILTYCLIIILYFGLKKKWIQNLFRMEKRK